LIQRHLVNIVVGFMACPEKKVRLLLGDEGGNNYLMANHL
jgi:hypothetical protein